MPAIFLLAPLFLFVVLIYEETRLSRDKIRQQFAIDLAAAEEMEQYTGVLNRLAYVNGVFPDRIFREIYGNNWAAYYAAGVIPAAPGGVNASSPIWPIQYGGGGYGGGRDWANVPEPPADLGYLHLNPANSSNIRHEGDPNANPTLVTLSQVNSGGSIDGSTLTTLEAAQTVALGFIQVYQWLGDVAAAEKLVFEQSILANHPLLREGLLLNLMDGCPGGPSGCGVEAANDFQRILISEHTLAGFKYCAVLVNMGGQVYNGVMSGAFSFGFNGLWQLSTVSRSDLAMLKQGFVVTEHWTPSRNYFQVTWPDVYVRTLVSTSGGSVWPNTTPKYATHSAP